MLAPGQARSNRLQVDLGFSASRHAVKQMHREPAGRSGDGINGVLLRGVWLQRCRSEPPVLFGVNLARRGKFTLDECLHNGAANPVSGEFAETQGARLK